MATDVLERDLTGEVRRLATELEQAKRLLIAVVRTHGATVVPQRYLTEPAGLNVVGLPDGDLVVRPVLQAPEQPLVLVPRPVIRQ